ncbi:hypothetical protein GCM10022224_090530 [Nonomuraea antimicrobica]|uniref:Ricin B lectin domain-containing protein n=1 Tax=Nonomuraea antimicrobica TaxID=561173 RepID=A0ABP7DVR9_9ACTN
MNKIFRKTSIAMAVGVVASVTSLTGTASASAATFELLNYNGWAPELCLAIAGGSKANGARAIQWGCNGGNEQRWYWSGTRLVNANSGKCLAIGNASKVAGAAAIQWECGDGAEQRWRKVSMGAGEGWGFQNYNSNKWLAVPNSSQANGTPVIQWHASQNQDQNWAMRMHG